MAAQSINSGDLSGSGNIFSRVYTVGNPSALAAKISVATTEEKSW
jgi:hypothetical protein